ncbi:LacI family transcriptional regulator [Herbiconiux moechotypicola]|uniref:LacI family DNA-binding transcriptional regulator n=1 Tax=Herbiconiux moechotypicola TaxID=637393 RepID=A0ABN3D8U0_9MICO|nr:LacI family DNA-binding transcriptional regulator [Herbiconiux moechotypicola]MCS5728213.1 LacI family transcriptional regulator [Herbiconiux moechotypicola]
MTSPRGGGRPRAARPTIRDVAAMAGVSSGTVSRVLNGKNWVSPDARSAVEAAIATTGYRVNPHARNLALSRANSVAFLLTETQQVLFEDPNFARLVRGTTEALAARDVSSVLIMAGDLPEQSRAMAYIAAGHVDGVLLAFTSAGGTPLMRRLVEAGVPLVACGMPVGGFDGAIGSVSADDRHGAVEMVRYLVSRGHRRIATIAGPADTPGGIARLEGYRQVISEQGGLVDADDALVEVSDYTVGGGAAAMRALLARRPDLDAVFAANDAMAVGALDALRSAGRRVPDDVAVAGFDDNDFAARSTPALTTVRQPFPRIAAEMVRVLLETIGGEQPASVTLPTSLVLRETA